MRFRETLPWNWGKKEVPVRREGSAAQLEPSVPSVRNVFDLFDEMRLRPFRMPSLPSLQDFGFADDGGFLPALDARETDDEIKITVELPGMEEKDVDVALKNDVLTIRGEKHDESKHETDDAQWVERRYGSFRRAIPLPSDVDAEAVKAYFKAGILTVIAPRTGKPDDSHRAIPIETD